VVVADAAAAVVAADAAAKLKKGALTIKGSFFKSKPDV